LEVRLIGRNNDLIGVFEDKKENKKKKEYSVRRIVDEQEYSKSVGERMVS